MDNRRSFKLIIIGLLALCVYFFYLLIDQQSIIDEKTAALDAIEKKIEEEKEIGSALENQLKIIDTDEYIEMVARQRLGMVKPGERIYIDVNK